MKLISVKRRLTGSATALAVALLMVACGSSPKDDTAGKSIDELYSDAREESAAGSYERAEKLYERLEGRAAGTMLAQQAQLERAYLAYRQNEKAQALAIIERFIKLHPTSPALDYAIYLQGLVNFNDDLGLFGRFSKQDLSERDQQASRDAYLSFKQLSEQFPDSKYTPDAQLRMNYIVNSLAAYEVHVARYYFRRGAYLAAANRAQEAIKEFQRSPATEEALSLLARSYDRLGMTQLRDDAARVLRQNYPTSRFLSDMAFAAAPVAAEASAQSAPATGQAAQTPTEAAAPAPVGESATPPNLVSGGNAPDQATPAPAAPAPADAASAPANTGAQSN